MSIARGTAGADVHKRFLDPRAEYVLWDYHFERDDDDRVLDRSRYENHAQPLGTSLPSSTASALMVEHAPVQGFYPYRNRSNEKRIAVFANSAFYDIEVT
jgi:hypothetical protein